MIFRNYLWKWIQRDPLRYHSLHSDLISARSGVTLEQYLWRAIKIAFLTGILFAVIGYFVSTFLSLQVYTGRAGIYNVFNLQLPVFFNTVYTAAYIQALAIIASFIIGTIIGYSLVLRLPGIEKNSRSIKINMTLHNAWPICTL
jgi:flagellar protein FlaJ